MYNINNDNNESNRVIYNSQIAQCSKKQKTEESILNLPYEIINLIFSYIEGKQQIGCLSRVNRTFRHIAREQSPFGQIFTTLTKIRSYLYLQKIYISTNHKKLKKFQAFPSLNTTHAIDANYTFCSLDLKHINHVIKTILRKNIVPSIAFNFYNPEAKLNSKNVKKIEFGLTHYLIQELFKQQLDSITEQLTSSYCWDLEYAMLIHSTLKNQQDQTFIRLTKIKNLFDFLDNVNPTVEMIQNLDWSCIYNNRKAIYGDCLLGVKYLQWLSKIENKDFLTNLKCDSLFEAAADLLLNYSDLTIGIKNIDELLNKIPKYLFNKKSFVLRGINLTSQVYIYASAFQNDKEIILHTIYSMIRSSLNSQEIITIIQAIEPSLYHDDFEIFCAILLTCKSKKITMNLPPLSKQFANNREIALLACQVHEKFFNEVDERFKTDRNFSIEVLSHNFKYKDHVSIDDAVLLQACRKNSLVYTILPDRLKLDTELALNFLDKNRQSDSFKYIPDILMNSAPFIQCIYLNHSLFDSIVDLELKKFIINQVIMSQSNVIDKRPLNGIILYMYYELIEKNPAIFTLLYKHFTQFEKHQIKINEEQLIVNSLKANPRILSFIPDHIKRNKNFMFILIQYSPLVYQIFKNLFEPKQEIVKEIEHELLNIFSNPE